MTSILAAWDKDNPAESAAQAIEGLLKGGEAANAFRERDQQILGSALRATAKRLEALYGDSLAHPHSPGFRETVEVAFANLSEVFARCLPTGEALAKMGHDPERIAAAVVDAALAIQIDVFADPYGEARKILTLLVRTTYETLKGDAKFMESLQGVNWTETFARLGRIEGKIDRNETEAERRHRESQAAAEQRHRESMAASEALRLEMAREKGVAPDVLKPLFDHLGLIGLSARQMREQAEAAIRAILAKANERVAPSNLGADIDAIIVAARARLSALDTAGAESILDNQIAQEEAAFRRRQVPLLAEKAAVQRLAYNHEGAKTTLRRLLAVDSDSVWTWCALGDVWRVTGSVTEALVSYRQAAAAAQRTDNPRDLSVSYDRIGDVLVSQGNLPEALKSYQAGLAIAERLARTDAGNSDWQRDLSVSNNKIGDVLVSQGNLPEALKSYQAGLSIRERLARTDAGNSDWQRDLIVSCVKIAGVFPAEARTMLGRASAIANRLEIEGRLAPIDAWMPDDLARRLADLPEGA